MAVAIRVESRLEATKREGRMLEDLADLFEQSAANGTPIRAVVGEDPVEFAETFLANYSEGQWINKERSRLIKAIDDAAEGGQK